MIFSGRSLQDLSLDDFQTLIANQIPEGPNLDYKETAYSGRPQDIREMLRDITALANAAGGYLILGIREDGFGRAISLTPIDDPQTKVQAIHQACLDGIRDRIDGLEVQAYDTGFNQGIIVVRVPPSEQRPHMMVRDHSTDFFRRYNTDKRAMTIGEIRETILDSPRFRRLVELELIQQGQRPSTTISTTESSGPPYAQIFTERPVERFLQRYFIGATLAHVLVIVSPFISDLAGGLYDLNDIIAKINDDRTRTYVITRPPREAYQQTGMDILQQCPFVEIRYNPDVHAKLYVCWSRNEEESYALFGSGNLTSRGLRHNLELGMMIDSRGYGRTLVRELYQWGSATVRTISQRVKAITA